MKHFLLPEEGNFYKANLHTHTTVSDGSFSPEAVKKAYLEQGYSIVAFTDHEVLLPHPELCGEDFLPITSFEISVDEPAKGNGYSFLKTYHLNLYAKDPAARYSSCCSEAAVWLEHSRAFLSPECKGQTQTRHYSAEFVNGLIRKANEEGFLVSYNHPVWSSQNYADYAALKGLWGVEVYNTGCVRVGLPDTPQPFDDLLRKGERVFPLATDDSHGDGDRFGGFVMVKAKRLRYPDVMDALERGDFYASSGPAVTSLVFEDGIVRAGTSPAREIVLSTERRFACRKSGEGLRGAEFDLRAYLEESLRCDPASPRPYFRLTVTDEAGERAYTRAYFLSEFGL